MDYIRQLNGFWNWRRNNVVSHVQADLYYTILACANAAYWPEPLSVPNTTLFGMCRISKSELHKQRLILIQKGLIRYSNGKKGTSGFYSIVPLYETHATTYKDTHIATNMATDTATSTGNISKTKYKYKKENVSRAKKSEAAATSSGMSGTSYDLEEITRRLNETGFF